MSSATDKTLGAEDKQMASDKELIEAVLQRRAYELATRELGVSHMARHQYSEVFTITRQAIHAYVADHGLPQGCFCAKDGPHGCEGLHFVRRGNGWVIFWLERGVAYNEQMFDSEQDAKTALVDFIIGSAGAGL
jgi:hypothetical protein